MAPHADIHRLIPQRPPILMVDRLIKTGGGEGVTSFAVKPDSFFVEEDSLLEAGLIENIAQSALAVAGEMSLMSGNAAPGEGYIGEVKRFRCLRRPHVGEELRTTVRMGEKVGDITVITGETRVGDETVARTEMKIFVKDAP